MERLSSKKLILGFTGLSFITFTVKLAAQMMAAFLFSSEHIGGGLLYNHNSITIITAAVLLFVAMQRLNIGDIAGEILALSRPAHSAFI